VTRQVRVEQAKKKERKTTKKKNAAKFENKPESRARKLDENSTDRPLRYLFHAKQASKNKLAQN